MKKLVLILVIPFLVISCSVQKKTTTEEDYNVTINKLVNKLLINPDNQKNIQILSIKLDYADKIKVQYVCIIGENELADRVVQIKNMKTGEKENVKDSDVLAFFE